MTSAQFDDLGIRFEYPADWELEVVDSDGERATVMVQSGDGLAFAMLTWPGLAANVAGYTLGSFGCVGMVALFVKVDSARRNSTEVVYLEAPFLRYLWSAVLLAGIGACGVHAWYIATELAARA